MKCWPLGCCEDARYKISEIINKERKKETKVVSPSVPGPPPFFRMSVHNAITGVHSISEFYKYTTHFKLKYLHLHHR